jgi:AcrR family transcriptional regulator
VARRTRARAPAAKDLVRKRLIAAGRTMFATTDYSSVSLRGIAKLANCTPGAIYQYFPDRRALFLAIRELDLSELADALEGLANATPEPLDRVHALVQYSIDYWRKNLSIYGLRFVSEITDPIRNSLREDGSYVESSPSSGRIHALFARALTSYCASLPGAPVPSAIAIDSLLAATQGVLVMPNSTTYRRFTAAHTLASALVNGLLQACRSGAPSLVTTTERKAQKRRRASALTAAKQVS